MKYRKRPLIVEAEQYTPGKEAELRVCKQACHPFVAGVPPSPAPHIHVGEALQYLGPGDYIITEGDSRYVCPKNLFAQMYEEYVPDGALAPSVYDEAERLIREAATRKEADPDGPSLDEDAH